jgi:hypothetical protein
MANGLFRFFSRDLVDAEAEDGHLDGVVQSDGLHGGFLSMASSGSMHAPGGG